MLMAGQASLLQATELKQACPDGMFLSVEDDCQGKKSVTPVMLNFHLQPALTDVSLALTAMSATRVSTTLTTMLKADATATKASISCLRATIFALTSFPVWTTFSSKITKRS